MTETILCPGCSTRFALRTERVRVGIRRAKCFKCDTIFGIEEAVERLLGAAAPVDPAGLPPFAAPVEQDEVPPFAPVEQDEMPPFAPVEQDEVPSFVAVEQDELPPFDDLESFAALPEPPAAEAAATLALPSPFAAAAPEMPPSLTLGDLEGSEEEIMEKTLVILPPAEAGAEAPEAAEAGASGFSSAKDAIAKLMGGTPPPPPPSERRQLGARSPMDVEATLTALEDTLAGTQPLKVQAPVPDTASTVKLSAQEIQAAMATLPAPPAPVPPPPPAPAPLPPPPPPVFSVTPPSAQGADLLKIQVETETLSNVSLDQVNTWIEQGRIKEYHMVARQFSDHWIEANKVPSLRPAFDRKRRADAGKPAELPTPPPDLQPARKSLFGGLFGRN